MDNETRLDATDIAFFRRKLESVDSIVYKHKFPEYMAQQLIAPQDGVDEDANVYTYDMTYEVGEAQPVGHGADDTPTADVGGGEFSQRIQDFTFGYKYLWREIRAAAKANMDLDSMRAVGARRAHEAAIDKMLSIGSTRLGLKGILTLSGTTTHTSAGAWGTLATATAANIYHDIAGLVNKTVEATDGAWQQYTVVLPLSLYNLAAELRMGSVNDTTVLDLVKQKNPYIAEIKPWWRTEYTSAEDNFSGKHRMACFPKAVEVVSALVPRDVTFLPPEPRGLQFVVPGLSSCGGVVCRHPKAIGYCDITP
jgi:hypothetical protein